MRTLRLEQLDGGLSDGGERSSVRYCCTRKDAARDRYFGGRGQGYIGAKGPQRPSRQVFRGPADQQGRGGGREGNRAWRAVREHGRADAEGGRREDRRACGRRRQRGKRSRAG